MKRRTLLGAIGASMLGMAGCLGQNEYTLSEPDIEQTDDPFRIDATLSNRDVTIDGPATLTLTLENTGETPLQIRTTDLWPFGVPVFGRQGDQYGEIQLLSDRYDETDNVDISVTGWSRSMSLQGQPITQTLSPGDPLTREYTVRGDLITTEGTYQLQQNSMRRPPSVTPTQRNNSSNKTVKRRSPPDDWQYLFKYRPKNGDTYYAYQPTVSITVSTKSLLPDL
ncbi:hypothetical protein [Halocatena pleomorpha]|uniref:DUF8130 domain-containing protein n=1 Tax=Halocatena pleomorpha TaxID=1785090 RepID=A0A3P3RCS6_9EURY|nr:hypothetical protein [Halocatena pleomorpha]RRJ31292.1 hypothetical protein EIK79_07800 [Halocatena pleomorpha]